MLFSTDKQTTEDLGIFGRRGSDSVYGIYDRTVTRGGASILEEMFRYPLSDAKKINDRGSIIRYFAGNKSGFPFRAELFDVSEQYLDNTDERTRLPAQKQIPGKRLAGLIAEDPGYKNIYRGVTALAEILQTLQAFITGEDITGCAAYAGEREAIALLLEEPAFQSLLEEKLKKKLPYTSVAGYDNMLRFRHRESMRKILHHIYYLDVYMSVAGVAGDKGLSFPLALPGEHGSIAVEGVYHPLLKNPVANDITFSPESNVIFLTGANMAGKSTLMKSLGIAMYVAHTGFPVAAKKMAFSVRDGIYTTINLPDDLGMGASHFYAEVLRVKKVARELSLGKKLFVIFDELFRGTNVKDAYEATVAITSAFAGKKDSMFIISTHIIEAGETLKERCKNIFFEYLPTRMKGTAPEYTYRLEKGITDDRHGMVIIRNEGILDILKAGQKKAQS